MADRGVDVPCCDCCGVQLAVMKRCVQCRTVYYCSRQCQTKDWLRHKTACLKTLHTQTELHSRGFIHDEKSVFAECGKNSTKESFDNESATKHDNKTPRYDFQTAASDLRPAAPVAGRDKKERPFFINNSTLCYDIPKFDSSEPSSEITVRYNKSKVRVNIQDAWNGSDIFKVFASELQIPLEKVKIIHKGRLLSRDTIQEAVRAGSVFQAIGEKCADENGVNKRSIEIMMSQLQIDRNSAVRALNRQPDLLDAMLETANNT